MGTNVAENKLTQTSSCQRKRRRQCHATAQVVAGAYNQTPRSVGERGGGDVQGLIKSLTSLCLSFPIGAWISHRASFFRVNVSTSPVLDPCHGPVILRSVSADDSTKMVVRVSQSAWSCPCRPPPLLKHDSRDCRRQVSPSHSKSHNYMYPAEFCRRCFVRNEFGASMDLDYSDRIQQTNLDNRGRLQTREGYFQSYAAWLFSIDMDVRSRGMMSGTRANGENRDLVRIAVAICLVCIWVFLGLRVSIRWPVRKLWSFDDWMATAATVGLSDLCEQGDFFGC